MAASSASLSKPNALGEAVFSFRISFSKITTFFCAVSIAMFESATSGVFRFCLSNIVSNWADRVLSSSRYLSFSFLRSEYLLCRCYTCVLSLGLFSILIIQILSFKYLVAIK